MIIAKKKGNLWLKEVKVGEFQNEVNHLIDKKLLLNRGYEILEEQKIMESPLAA